MPSKTYAGAHFGAVLTETNERWLEIALRAGGIGAWDWDIPADRIQWSERVYEIHGLQPGEFGGTMAQYRTLVHPDDLGAVEKAIEEALRGDRPYAIEFRVVRPGGEARWVATSAESMRDERGNPLRLIGATVDVTDRKRTEDALLRANQEMEQFAYAASHDLQEPLRTVTNFTQLLAREAQGKLGSDADQYIQFIVDGARRMRALIDGLLALSRAGTALAPIGRSTRAGSSRMRCAHCTAPLRRAARKLSSEICRKWRGMGRG